ncbi:hypothetical protein HG531_009781 [Fusarium graminearum]|nr:hypothetical protein HG531_009781 [Fusarium graminearum]
MCEESTVALDGGVEGVEPGVVDNTNNWLAVDGEAQRDAGAGERMDEVGGTVDGVYNKGRLGAKLHTRLSGRDHFFNTLVCFGDDVDGYRKTSD